MSGGAPEGERWTRLRTLVERALGVPPEEREALLASAAEGDAELLREARELMALEQREDAFSDESGPAPISGGLEAARAPAAASAPRTVGPYELRRELGAGGMGRVFLGVRADRAYHQRVAVKLLHLGAADAEVHERFRRERQVLANLEHPGIARLVDGGVAEDGTPYLAMEYVEGMPVDRYCDENRLTTRERLALFRKICDAVHDAHRNLVVHRDIKPSNVVVTPAGEPKLLDFGIAKVLDPEKSAAEVDVTGPMMRFMTPAYASPEQLRGRPITTASDVYSLGVLLYKLLTGHLPYVLTSRSGLEIERIVCEEEPERPSTAISKIIDLPPSERTPTAKQLTPELVSNRRMTTPRLLKRTLAGDLDRVVMKALRKEPQRRYASAEQLSEDVRHYLEGLPVIARPDTRAYRTVKFLRRHRVPVALAALALLALVGALSFSLTQYRRADAAAGREREQRELAVQNMEESRALALELEREKGVAEGRLAEVEALNVELEAERELAQARLGELTDLALTIVFDLHRAIYALEGATEATELALRTGLGAMERLGLEGTAGPELLRRLSGGYLRLGEVQGDPEAPNLGRLDDCAASYRHGFELAQRALDFDPNDPANAFAYASAATKLAGMLAISGSRDEELTLRLAALEACEALPAATRAANDGLAYVHHVLYLGLADTQRALGQLEEALASTEDGGRVLDEFIEARPGGLRFHGDRVQVALRRGRLLLELDELEEGLQESELALALAEEEVERRPESGDARRMVRVARELVGKLLLELDQQELALELFAMNDEEQRERVTNDPENQQAWQDLYSTCEHLALGSSQLERYDEAIEAALRGLEITERLVERSGGASGALEQKGSLLLRLSSAERESGRLLEAVDHAQQSRRLFEELLQRGPERPGLWRALLAVRGELGIMYRTMADRDGATDARRADLERAREWFRGGLAALDALEDMGLALEADLRLRARLEEDVRACDVALSGE